MEAMNRRDLCTALSAFAMLAGTSVVGQSAAQPLPGVMAVPAPPGSTGDPSLSTPRTFVFEDLPIARSANGEVRAVTRGVLPTGEAVELHETTLLPGHMPHPPHSHRHSEFILVREGTMEFNNDGKLARVGPGGVIFAASNIPHGMKNVGDTTANYFVIAIGREA